MDAGLDTGPMLAVRHTPIDLHETAIDVSQRLQALGAELLREEIPRLVAGQLTPVAQDESQHTLAPLMNKELSRIDWNRSARAVHDQVRGLQPWPGASTTLGARRLIVNATRLDDPPTVLGGAPGEVVAVQKDRLWVATRDGLVALTEVQLEGKRRMPMREFLGGHPMRTGTLLGTE